MPRPYIPWILGLLILLIGGVMLYDYVKKRPPGFLLELVTKTAAPPPLPAGVAAPLNVPPGFSITIFSRDVPGARVMTRDPRGALLVSLTGKGEVVALNDPEGDGTAAEPVTVLSGLRQPHGLYVRCVDEACTLYVAETDALKSYSYDAADQTATYEATLLALPSGQGHFTRTILPHPDNRRLLVSVGSSCNVCTESEDERASVLAYDLQTGQASIFAKGLRNTVFMELHPVTGDIWGTDNGRDLIGDDIPPDEVNIIREGEYYGWPICYGNNTYDVDFNARPGVTGPCAGYIPPHLALQAHSAALGLDFIPEEGWPADLHHDLLVAYHGSWNRSIPTGYKVVRFDLAPNGAVRNAAPFDFITGFMPEGGTEDDVIGRPVGILTEPGGIAFISDDRAGAIYRLTWLGSWP